VVGVGRIEAVVGRRCAAFSGFCFSRPGPMVRTMSRIAPSSTTKGGSTRVRTAAPHEVAAPEPNRVFPHAERRGNPPARPARPRQKNRTGALRLAAITRARQACRRRRLFQRCRKKGGLSRHAWHPPIAAGRESGSHPLVSPPISA